MIQKFSCSTISQAPESPGLYAWYGKVDIGDSDYLKLIIDRKDHGEDRLRSLLSRHTQRFNLPAMHVRITSSFESEWRASCAEQTAEKFAEILSGAVQENGIPNDQEMKKRLASLDKTMAKQKHRQLLKQALEYSVPVFSAPLYIGVSDNLRPPLKQKRTEVTVADVTLDQALPVVRNLAGRKASAFVRSRSLAVDEREDVESQLVLIFIPRWPKFDGERASVQT